MHIQSLSLLATGLLAGGLGAQTASGVSAVGPKTGFPAGPSLDRHLDLAGIPTDGFPHFTCVDAFQEGDTIRIGIDTGRNPGLAGRPIDIYVLAHRTPAQWQADPHLVDLVGGPREIRPVPKSLARNVIAVDTGRLAGFDGSASIGTGYDIVLDTNRNGVLDRADRIDGWGSEPGFVVFGDLTQPGPYTPKERKYNGGTFKRQEIFFPSEIATLGELPLIVVSHGNGHNYTWYSHIGNHMASWGYIVMSHQNNTGPGIKAASTTTLTNTEEFLGNLDKIAGGQLQGHVDTHSIVWMGHSRGGEGVVRAYKRLVGGDPIATLYSAADIRLVSSMAPTDFLGPGQSEPLGVPYHLWTGAADNDVNGCADSNAAQPFHLFGRARGERMSISIYGAGHGDFHNGGGSSVAAGPCKIGRSKTHRILRGHLLPLVDSVLHGNSAAREYLWRQWERFRPLGAPVGPCIVVDLMYQEDPADGKLVLDDFQTNAPRTLSSSGGQVVGNVDFWRERRLDDRDRAFTTNTDPMNGMTMAGPNDTSSGITLGWPGGDTRYLLFEVPDGYRDLSDFATLSLRAAQASRHPLTAAELGDLDFTVELYDLFGHRSAIRIGAYGGGIEEPYQRAGCGKGRGWASDWETIRIPLEDFRADGRRMEMRAIVAVGLRFGPRFGSDLGRIGIDDIEFTKDGPR